MEAHTAMNHNQRFRQKDLVTIELDTLKKIFEDRPLKSMITLSCKCSGCGNDLLLDITHTSGGFGFSGGFLLEYAPDKYLVRCRDCHHLDNKISKF